LLYPETRFPGANVRRLEETDAGLRLCRLGYEKGYRAVLQAAGPDLLEESPALTAECARKTSGLIVIRAGLGFGMGLTSATTNPELVLAQELKLLGPLDTGAPKDALSAMSLSMSIYESFMGIMRPEAERRVALQRGVIEEPETEPAKPADGTGTGQTDQPAPA